MRKVCKLFIYTSLLIFASSFLFAQTSAKKYQITSVKYNIQGITRESVLDDALDIDKNKVFKDQEEFDEYMSWLRGELDNNRIFKDTSIQVFYGNRDSTTGITPVELLVSTTETHNKIVVPYPKINSNTGAQIKVKLRDYNFLGSMQMFDLDFTYNYYTAETPKKHIVGLYTGFMIPFRVGDYNIYWNNSIDTNQTIKKGYKPYVALSSSVSVGVPIDKKSNMNFSLNGSYTHETNKTQYASVGTTISYSRALTENLSLGLTESHTFYRNPDYANDIHYFNNSFGISFPVKVGTIPNFATVTWTPSGTFSKNWDIKALSQNRLSSTRSDMIDHPDLKGPTFTFGHSIGAGRIEWVGKYKKGFSVSFGQFWIYNFYKKNVPQPYFTLNTDLRLPGKRIALYNRNYWYYSLEGNTTTFAERMRGIKDNDNLISYNMLVMNFDLPIKLLSTDFEAWDFPFGSKLKKIDMEVHFAPFLDVALGFNPKTGTNFLIADGYYAGGFEVLVHPYHMKSVIGRLSLGIDLARTILPGRLVNKGWRENNRKWELTFGLGAFY
ncbi:MAG: hypothetical protein IKZ86_13010 [Spirochaetaceae bacterium]|nr:hypothetical protein [Spirochaetaceae bacterium]